MNRRRLFSIVFALGGFSQAQGKVDFAKDVQPILESSCYSCHGTKVQMGGLRLDSNQLASKVIRPGKSSESPLYLRVAGIGDQARMPMGGKPLDPAQIALIRTWIDQGAEWPESAVAEIKKHWAYIPPGRPTLPAVKNSKWPANAIDNFILARASKKRDFRPRLKPIA